MKVFGQLNPIAAGRISVLLIVAISMCACGPSIEERLARGQQSYNDGDYRAASVDARSVLQESPESLQGRLLLGRTALALGDLPTAAKELDRALSLGANEDDIGDTLGNVWLAQGEYARVLEELPVSSNASPESQRLINFLRARAYLGLGEFDAARSAFQEILAADDEDTQAMLGIVATYLEEGENQQAWATLEQVRGLNPDNVAVVLQSAILHLMSGNTDSARTDYQRALDLAKSQSDETSQIAALQGLVEVAFLTNDVEAAEEQLNALIVFSSADLRTRYFQGRLAYLKDDIDEAQKHLQSVLRQAPNLQPAQLLIGAVHLRRGNLGQAELYLAKLVNDDTDNSMARRLLAETRMRQRQLDAAGETLQPLLRGDTADSGALALAAQISIASGDFGGAIEYLRQRADQEPENAGLSMDLAGAYLASGHFADAAAVIERTSPSDGRQRYRLDMMRILAAARSGDFGKALKMVEVLQKQRPDDAAVLNTLGAIHLTIGNSSDAIHALQASLQVKPDSPTTLMLLGRAEASAGRFVEAKEHFETVLPLLENRGPALRSLALIAAAQSDSDAAIDWLEQASDADPNDATSRIFLARQLLLQQASKPAYDAAMEAVKIAPDSADAYQVLGEAQEQLADLAGARDSFDRASSLNPGEARHVLSHARVLEGSLRSHDARQVLDSFAKQVDGDLPATLRLAMFEADNGNIDAAHALVSKLITQHPDSAMPLVAQGELFYRNGDAAGGARTFDAALDKSMDIRIVNRAFQLRSEHGSSDAIAPLVRYLKANPENIATRLVLAQHQQSNGQPEAAAGTYDAVLSRDPDNFVALNNLAWILNDSGDKRAVEIAERAYQLAPENPSVIDTYGWVLVTNGKSDEGIDFLRRAVALSDGKPQIRYHLAAALSARGDEAEARQILEGLVTPGTEFAARNEAKALLTKLQISLSGS